MSCKLAGWGSALALSVWLWTAPAQARFFRARFDPDTLELQKPGNLELNLQAGGLYGDGVDRSRIVLPDYEVDMGLLKWLEVDIDGAFSVTHLGTSERAVGGDPLWTSARVEVLNLEDKDGKSFGIGAQFGPRFRTVDNARGVGLGSLILIGGGTRTLRAVGNLGCFLDRDQAGAIVYGGALEWDLQRRRKWTLQAQMAGAHYFGNTHGDTDPSQALLLAGLGTELTRDLMVSLLAVTGPFAKGDRAGLMASVTWDHQLW
jgi:hypothetical protein